MKINVSISNSSTCLNDVQVSSVISALQKQVSLDFAPIWGADASLSFVPKGKTPDPESWHIVVLDNSDQAGALGYHDVTPSGLPLGKIFAKDDIDYGSSWTVTMSHELLEMLADPDINRTFQVPSSDGSFQLYAAEVCDPCEDDSVGYQIDGILVSDFVYPAWFKPATLQIPSLPPYDKTGALSYPLNIAFNGYQSIYSPGSGWHQVYADMALTKNENPNKWMWKRRPRIGSRRERRLIPRQFWSRSLKESEL